MESVQHTGRAHMQAKYLTTSGTDGLSLAVNGWRTSNVLPFLKRIAAYATVDHEVLLFHRKETAGIQRNASKCSESLLEELTPKESEKKLLFCHLAFCVQSPTKISSLSGPIPLLRQHRLKCQQRRVTHSSLCPTEHTTIPRPPTVRLSSASAELTEVKP